MADLFSGISNSDLAGGVGGIVGGIGSLFGGFGKSDAFQAEAQGFATAAQFANENATLSGEVGGLQELAAARQIQHVEGSQVATAAGNGLHLSGSALSLIRDSASQGALAEGQIGLRTAIAVTNYQGQAAADLAQQQAAQAQASAAETGGIFGALGGAIKAIPLIGGLF